MRLLFHWGLDEAYVGVVRAWVANPKRFRTRHLWVSGLLLMAATMASVLVATGYGRLVRAEANSWPMVGFVVGQKAGFLWSLAGFSVFLGLWAFRGQRMDRLMITYYDRLKGRRGDVEETGDDPFEGWVGSAGDSFKARYIRWINRKDYGLKAKTDKECIVLARRYLKRPRWVRVLFLGFAVLHVILGLGFLRLADPASEIFGPKPWAAVVTGLISGLFVGLLMCRACLHFMELLMSLRCPRVGRLMLRYHDALRGEVQGDEE